MISLLLFLVLALLTAPAFMFVLECVLGSLFFRSKQPNKSATEIRCAIIMPAHNEAEVIAATLTNLKQAITDNDQVVVVADNCSDNTADIAREFGFTVLERENQIQRGKGYALDHGMQSLKEQDEKPDVVVIVDADCQLASGSLDVLKHAVVESGRPAQACYLMQRGEITRTSIKVSEFAFMVKNKIRLRGSECLGIPVPLTGTGMAFPWQALAEARLATGDIVEDMRLGVELAEKGKGARYVESALVTSLFPQTEAAEKTQRERWEHGHLSTLQSFVPKLAKRAWSQRSYEALGMMLDLIIPPLSLFVMIIGAVWFASGVIGLFTGIWFGFKWAGFLLVSILVAITLSWLVAGRHIISAKELAHIPFYIISKIVIYIAYLVRKQTEWIRTDRGGSK